MTTLHHAQKAIQASHLNRRGSPMSADSQRVLAAIARHPGGISTVGLTAELEALPPSLSKTLANLRDLGHIANVSGKRSGAPALWALARLAPSVSAMAVDDAAARRDTLKAMPHGGRSQAVNKSPERLAVEDCLALAGARGRTRAELCRITGLDEDDVQRVLQHLVAAQRGDSVTTPGTERHWRLLSAVARDEAARPKAATARVCNASTEGDYLGTELQPNPGITADRFAAFLLPSLVNGVRVPPKRITAMCTGPAGPVGGGVSVNVRFAK